MRRLFGTIFVAACSCAAAAETITADVAVVGGGSAGFAAAWSAATLGSSVVLIEKEKVLGGTSTIGGVNNWEPVWGATGVPWRVYERLRRIPKAAGVYEFAHHCSWPEAGGGPVFPGGLLTTNPDLPYEKTLRRHGPGMGNEAWFRENCHGVIFEPEAMERTMLAMLQETGRCRVLFGAVFHDVARTGAAADALTLADGRTVRAKVVVDACGAVCAKMGCEIMRGHEAKSAFNEPGAPDQANDNVNGATLIYRITPRKDGQEEYHVPPPGVPTACWWGGFPYAFCCEFPGGDIGINMLPTISGAQLKNLDEAGAMRECRRRVHAHWRWMQDRWPDFRKYRLKEIAPVLARRETWRVRGEYVLNQNDLIVGMDGQTHDDVIALADHPMDSHGGGGPGGGLKAPYGIPYRCLLPKGTSNILIAGRCASFSSIAASSCRLSRTMMQLGEAAGVAAHLSVTRGIPLREVPAADIRTTMERRLDSLHAAPASRFVECETFTDYGGWVVDPHSMTRMGSSYLMAHGYGTPVKDATRIVNFAEAGRYTVHVRTRDWSAEWRKGRGTPPGRFQVLVNGQPVGNAVLGTNGGEWAWQRAGEVDLPAGDATVALHDLTGFNARCDAVYFSTDPDDVPPNDARELEAYRPKKRHFSTVTDKTSYDLIVVGGGISGMCMAQSAARLGVRVLLLQDRGVLGGCNSSEIRVSLGGLIHQPPYPALGNLVEEFAPAYGGNKTYPAEWYEDTRKESVFRRTTQSCTLKFNEHVFAVEMDKAQTNRIRAVVSRNTRTGHETRFHATLFCDATGDAVLARLAGCETMYGREARARFNESCAPEKPVRQVMGHSVQWYAARTDAPVSFPDIDWGLPVTENSCYYVRTGDWEQEAGQYRDMADDTEAIRDYGLLSIFSNWSFLKNRSARKAEFANDRIEWVSPIGGKRESYRVVGDHVLTQNDIEDHVAYPDLTAAVTWNIDLHFPDPENEAKFEEPFRSCAYHRHYGRPYAVPYRCLYARDCANLFLAGRHVSCSHVAFAAVRVMRTLGMLGEVAGMAAAVCKKHGCLPRDVYVDHLDELKGLMRKGVPKLGVYHSGGCSGDNEFYHFKDTGHFPIWPKPRPMTPRVRDAIEKIGLRHRHEPEMKVGLAETDGAGRICFSCNSGGCVTNLSVAGDSSGMNWVLAPDVQYKWIGAEYAWGSGSAQVDGQLVKWAQADSCNSSENGQCPVYRPCPGLEVRVRRTLEDDGTVLRESYEFANVSTSAVRLADIDIHTPFNDNYLWDIREHLARRCHAHVWPGGAGGWVAAMRMGGTAPHLGLVVVEGGISGYGLKERALKKGMSNTRGVIALSPEDVLLAPGARKRVAWKVFVHSGWDDFFRKAVRLGGSVAQASKYVARVGEDVDISVQTAAGKAVTTWRCPSAGEHRVPVRGADGRRTWVEILGVGDVDARILARARFIVARQQVNAPGSPYDGALVPYDNEEERQQRRWEPRDADWKVDHSEGGERLGMGVLLAMMARRGHRDEFLPPLLRYYRFVRNGLQDPDYSSWQCVARPSRKRCFNYPWIIWFYLEMHRLTGEGVYLDDMYGTMRRLFSGDIKVPPSLVAMPFRECVEALRAAGRKEEAEQALAWYVHLAEPLVSADGNIKRLEVGMSPEMVSSGLNATLGLYGFTGEERYLKAARRLMTWAEAICGRQPSWHCHDIGLHHWDGYWFGKRQTWGDTLPHDWNGEMAQAFARYADATGDRGYRERAPGIADAMLGLFTDDGRGSCAWVYPNRVNGQPARFADPLANDQDWALVFYLWARDEMADVIEEKK